MKIRFRVIFREENVCANKLTNLEFIHREIIGFPSSMFLEFFINKYSLLRYRFC